MASSGGGNPFRAILDVGSALVSSVELDQVFANVARTIGEAMMVSQVAIHSFDHKQNAFVLEAHWSMEDGDGRPPDRRAPIPVAERPDLRRVTSRQELVERRCDDPALPPADREELERANHKSVLDAPLRVGREVLGVLSLIETRFVRRYAPMEQDLLVQLCGLAAISIRNAHLLRERDERTLHMRLLLDVGRAVTSSLVLEDVLKAVCQYIGEAMQVSSCDIQLYDRDHDRLIYAACWDSDPALVPTLIGAVIDPDERPSNRSALNGKPIECHLDDPDLPAAERAELERWGEKTTLDFPLVYGDETMGILGLIERDHVRRFTYEERALFEQLGVLASIAIRNAKVVRRLEDQNRQLEALLAIGRAWGQASHADDICATIAREAAVALGAPRAELYEHDATNGAVLRGAYGLPAGGQAAPAPPGDTATHDASDAGRPILVRSSDPGLDPSTRDDLIRRGERARLHVPVAVSGEIVGTLVIIETEGERLYDDGEIAVARGIAEQAGLALRAAGAVGVGWAEHGIGDQR